MFTEFHFVVLLTEQIQTGFFTESQTQKHSTVTSQTRISVNTRSQSQQRPIVPIQQLFQRSSQLQCFPADVSSLISTVRIA